MEELYFHVTLEVPEKSMLIDETGVPLGVLEEYVKSGCGGVVIVGMGGPQSAPSRSTWRRGPPGPAGWVWMEP